MNVALITGITGQDGAYLTSFLLKKGYAVHGVVRRSSQLDTRRIDHFYEDPHVPNRKLILHYGDMTDSTNVLKLIAKIKPDEIYNLAAQSHVQVSFDMPEYTANVDALGPLRILEAIKMLGLEKTTRFYQASTSELYGNLLESPQNEATPFHPRSPYGVAKLYAHWITKNYRESYGLHTSNGILFNHESPLRGETFVTRKITRGLARIFTGIDEKLYLGNLDAQRDWGHAREYVEGMWAMLQQKKPDDYVLATGRQSSVWTFLENACEILGWEVTRKKSGGREVVYCKNTRSVLVETDPRYRRPSEVATLLGDASKAKKKLKWQATITLPEIITEMLLADIYRCRLQLGQLGTSLPPVESLVHLPGGFFAWLRDNPEIKKELLPSQ